MKHVSSMRDVFVLRKGIRVLNVVAGDTVLHLGPGVDAVLNIVKEKGAVFHCVEPDLRRAKQLWRRYRGMSNIVIQHGPLANLPYPRHYFSKILFHNVTECISSDLELRRILHDMRRVGTPDVVVFVSGVAMAPRPATSRRSFGEWIGSMFQEGWRYRRSTGKRGSAGLSLYFSEDEFLRMCTDAGLAGGAMRIEQTHGFSADRNEYLLEPRESTHKKTPFGPEAVPEKGIPRESL